MVNIVEQYQIWALSELDRLDEKPRYVHDNPNDLFIGQYNTKLPDEERFDCYYSTRPLNMDISQVTTGDVRIRIRFGDDVASCVSYPIWQKPPMKFDSAIGFHQTLLNFANKGYDHNGWFDFKMLQERNPDDNACLGALEARERLEMIGIGGKRIDDIERDRRALKEHQEAKRHGMSLGDYNFKYNPAMNSFHAHIPVYDDVMISVIKSPYNYSDEKTFEVGILGLFREIEVIGFQSEKDIWDIYHQIKNGTFKRKTVES